MTLKSAILSEAKNLSNDILLEDLYFYTFAAPDKIVIFIHLHKRIRTRERFNHMRMLAAARKYGDAFSVPPKVGANEKSPAAAIFQIGAGHRRYLAPLKSFTAK